MSEMQVVRVCDGVRLPLEEIFLERRVALVFLRHLGCRFCKEQIAAIVQSAIARRLHQFGVGFACISLGSLEEARAWQQATGYEGELYVDDTTSGVKGKEQPGSLPYRVFKLKRGSQFVLGNEETVKRAQEVGNNFPDTPPVQNGEETIFIGDVLQIGGAFVLGPGNTCDYASRSRFAGDLLDLEAFEVAATGQKSNGDDYTYPSTAAWYDKMKLGQRFQTSEVLQLAQRGKRILSRHWRHVAAATVAAGAATQLREGNNLRAAGLCGAAGLLLCSARSSGIRVDSSKLLTPKEVDKFALEFGLVECDCSEELGSISMECPVEEHERAGLPSKKSMRARGMTWDKMDSFGSCPNEYQQTLCYVRSFLGKPHPAVGRKGPVCPFVPKALQLNAVRLHVVRTADIPANDLRGMVAKMLVDFLPNFEALEPKTGRQRQYKTCIFIFPDVQLADACDIIDGAQMDAKPNFVARGLMVGEFHAANNATGLRNPNFYPLRTPHPCLAIRHMVPGDFVFMTLDNYELDLQRKFLTAFLDVFGEEDRPEVKEAKEKLAALAS